MPSSISYCLWGDIHIYFIHRVSFHMSASAKHPFTCVCFHKTLFDITDFQRNQTFPIHLAIGHGTIRRCGLTGGGVALSEEARHCEGESRAHICSRYTSMIHSLLLTTNQNVELLAPPAPCLPACSMPLSQMIVE